MSRHQFPHHPYTAPLTDTEINSILEDLDTFETPEEVIAKREHKRVFYQSPVSVVCESIDESGANTIRFTAVTYDLSDSGLGMIAPLQSDIDTQCTLTLVSPTNHQLTIGATLKLCEPVAGRANMWGMKFDQMINATAFLSASTPNRSIA